MESQVNSDSFELFIKALGRASDKLRKKEKKEGRAFLKEAALPASSRARILSAMKSMEKMFDEKDKRLLYSREKMYELCEMPGRYNSEINEFLARIELAVNSYMGEKKDRDKRINLIEEKIKRKVTNERLEKRNSDISAGTDYYDRLRMKVLALKTRYSRLSKMKKSPETKVKLDAMRVKIEAFERRVNSREVRKNA
jgi:hypothetical protein